MSAADLKNKALFQTIFPNGMSFQGVWSALNTYPYGTVVQEGADLYICINQTSSVNELPSTNPASWTQIGGGGAVLPGNLVYNPLQGNLSGLSSLTNYNITDLGVLNASKVETDNITLQPGSLQPEIVVDDSLLLALSKKVKFVGHAEIEAGLGQDVVLTGNKLKFVSLSNAVHNHLVSYDITTNEMNYMSFVSSFTDINALQGNFSSLQASTITTNSTIGEAGFFSSLTASTIKANTFFTVSTIDVVEYVSSVNVDAKEMTTSTIFGETADFSTINLSSIGGSGDVVFDAVGSLVLNGKTLDMSGGRIHNCGYIESENNQDIVIEGKGSGDIHLSSLSTVVENTLWVGSNITAPNGFFSTLNTSTINGFTIPQFLQDSAYTITTSTPTNLPSSFSTYSNVWLNTSDGDLYGFQPPFDEPQERTLPTYAGTTYIATDDATFNTAVSSAIAGDIIQVNADILLSAPKTIAVGIKLTSDTGSRVLELSSATNIIAFTGDGVLVEGIAFLNPNGGSSAICLAFTSQVASNNYVKSCILTTNEFAITTLNTQIQITDNTFLFTGAQDGHRYIALYKNTANTIVARNAFEGNGPSPNTACIFIGSISGSLFTNGVFVFKNNTSSTAVQRLCICEVAFGVSDNVKFYIHDNTIQSSSGFVIFFNTTPLRGIQNIIAYNNIETLGGTATGSKGILAIDAGSALTLPSTFTAPFITSFSNSHPALRDDYRPWSFDGDIAFNSTVYTVGSNTPKLYSPAFQTEYILNSNALTTSSLTAGSVLADFGKFSTLQVSTMAGFSPITFLSSLQMNNNDILGVSTLSTVNVNVANLVVSSINGLTPDSVPASIGVSSLTTSTITFGSNGGIVDLFNIKQASGSNVFTFTPSVSRLQITNPLEPLVENNIQYNSISVGDGTQTALLSRSNLQMFSPSGETNIFPLGISTPSLTLTNLSNATTSDVLYFDTATSRVSRGTAPTASVGAQVFTSSIVASTLTSQGFVRVSNSPNIINQIDLSGMTYYNDVSGLRLVALNPQQFQVLSGSNYTMNVSDDFTITTGTLTLENNIAGSLKMPNIPSASNANVLYYDTSTKSVSYGATPSGGGSIPADLSISSLNAVSTLAVSSFTSSITSFFVSTNQLRANDGTFNAGILASGTIAGNNITANGIAPAGIVSGLNIQAQNSMSNISTFGRVANFSTLQVSTINGVVPTFGGGGSAPSLASYTGVQQLNLTYNAWNNVIWGTTPAFTSGAIGLTVDGAGIFTYTGSGNATYEIMYNVPFDTLTASNALYGMRCSTLAGVPAPYTQNITNVARPSAGSIAQNVCGTFYLNLTAVNQQFRFQVYGNEPASGQPGFVINRNGGTGNIQFIKII
jgi:hypothetical protein